MIMEKYPRSNTRQSVLKMAKLIFRETIIDCLVTDQSPSGARIRLATTMPLPDQLTIQFPGGSAFDAARRWSRGAEVGLEFIGNAKWGEEARGDALRIYEAMRDQQYAPLRYLRDKNHFDDPGLRAMATEAEEVINRLELELRARAQRLG